MNDLATLDSASRSVCTFRLDGRLYGIDVAHVREVNTHVAAAPVPQSPPGVRGLANLRSRIYLVIDLRPLLGLAPVESTVESRLIILKPDLAEDVGLLVDEGGDIIRVPRGDIDSSASAPIVSGAKDTTTRPLTRGVCQLESQLLILIDPAAVVARVTEQLR